MAITYEDVNPTLIENTTMQKLISNGVHTVYYITPVPGYVIHDKAADWTDTDPITEEEIYMLGYKSGTVSCAATYDFETNPREFYTVPEDSVPADQIFGIGNNDHVTA